jgi:signal peptidase II
MNANNSTSQNTTSFRWFILVAAWIAIDQYTKTLAVTYLKPIGSMQLMGDYLRLTYAENRGMAFSISIFPPWFLTLIACCAALVLSYQIWRHPVPAFRNVCLSLILAGAVGTVFDRFHYGYVKDFIDSDFPDFLIRRWPVFNLADSGITVGVILFGVYTLFDKPAPALTPVNTTSTTTSDNPA